MQAKIHSVTADTSRHTVDILSEKLHPLSVHKSFNRRKQFSFTKSQFLEKIFLDI
jgi:hypothetical protein